MLIKKQPKKQQMRSARSGVGSGQFQRNSLVISRSQRETEQHKQSVAQRQADRRRSAQRTVKNNRLVFAVLCLLSVAALYGLQIRSVTVVTSAGVSQDMNDRYRRSVEAYVGNRVALKQSWLLEDAELLLYIQNEYPEVEALSSKTPSLVGGALSVNVDFREPAYVWKSPGGTHYIDDAGVLFKRNVHTSINPQDLPLVEDQSSLGAEEGRAVVSEVVAQRIAGVYKYLPSVYTPKAKVATIVLPPRAREIQAKLEGVPYYIKYSSERGIEEQTAELRQLVDYLNKQNIQPAEYIDVRVENKVFYK